MRYRWGGFHFQPMLSPFASHTRPIMVLLIDRCYGRKAGIRRRVGRRGAVESGPKECFYMYKLPQVPSCAGSRQMSPPGHHSERGDCNYNAMFGPLKISFRCGIGGKFVSNEILHSSVSKERGYLLQEMKYVILCFWVGNLCLFEY